MLVAEYCNILCSLNITWNVFIMEESFWISVSFKVYKWSQIIPASIHFLVHCLQIVNGLNFIEIWIEMQCCLQNVDHFVWVTMRYILSSRVHINAGVCLAWVSHPFDPFTGEWFINDSSTFPAQLSPLISLGNWVASTKSQVFFLIFFDKISEGKTDMKESQMFIKI